jgi:hypothetical protein
MIKKIKGVPVDYVRPELAAMLPSYQLIKDVIEGERAIKGLSNSLPLMAGFASVVPSLANDMHNVNLSRAKLYLPQPNPSDQSQENQDRFRAYIQRAVFYGVTSRTLEGMAGQIFLRDPEVELPPSLEIMQDDVTGDGLPLNQFAYQVVSDCIGWGRAGILVDFPIMTKPVTQKQLDDGDIKPTFRFYHSWDIINWRTKKVNGQYSLTMLVLREWIDEEDNEFALVQREQFRVIRLSDTGVVNVQIYLKDKSTYTPQLIVEPKDFNGKPLKYIPFFFVGSKNNEACPNQPPLYDLASLNIAHYRNSADYEEACFICGQPTPVFSGVDESWVKDIWKGQITLGSRAAIPLPPNAKAELLQAEPNTLPGQAMADKEKQMVALGARLVQEGSVASTATENLIDTSMESSMLANVASNVSSAIKSAFKVACLFVGADPTQVLFELNKQFDITRMTADDQNTLVKQWQAGGITFSEMRAGLRRAGIVNQKDGEARVAIKQDIKDGLIPDPANPKGQNVPDPKAGSGVGGPQPNKG